MRKILLVTLLSMILYGCANTTTTNPEAQRTQNWSVEKLYNEAHDNLNSGNYTQAIKLYDLLQSRFPYGRYAEQTQIDIAYAYYLDEDQAQALAAIQRFQQQFPTSKKMDYMLYLKGLVLFNQHQSFLNKLAAQDWSDRDPKANREAYETFAQLIEKYPNSSYANDARKRMTKLVDSLGGHEIAVARYYMQRGAYLAAANRASNVVEYYRNTPFVEEALAIMVSAYQHMQQPKLSKDARRVLVQNYPNSRYLKKGWYPDNIPW